jgi:hypothetical protein
MADKQSKKTKKMKNERKIVETGGWATVSGKA